MDFSNIFLNHDFIAFNEKMLEKMELSSKSGFCIGFNFHRQQLTSIKFYYALFDKIPLHHTDFPIPELRHQYEKYIDYSIPHLSNPFSPGCGLSFAIKFDPQSNVTKGMYFRVGIDNTKIKDNLISIYPELHFKQEDFDDGYGILSTYKNGVVAESNYLYLNAPYKIQSLEKSSIIDFAKAEKIEINSCESQQRDQKFLTYKYNEKLSDAFISEIPSQLKEITENWNINLWCPAYNPKKKSFSIYIFDNPLFYDTTNNLIDKFKNRINDNDSLFKKLKRLISI